MSTLPTNALCTRLEVKNYMNMNQADSIVDNLIHDIIGRISTAFETYCSRKFTAQEITEYQDGGCRMIFTDNYPINSIVSIHEDSSWVFDSLTLTPSGDYRILHDRCIAKSGLFARGDGSVKVVYNAGYTVIPPDLKQAAIEEVGRKVKHRQDFDETVKTMGDGSVTYLDQGFLPQTKQTLDSYKWYAVL